MAKILITGASGFIGSALAKRLEATGHDIMGLYRYVADGRYDYYQLQRKAVCDIRSREDIFKVLREFKPDVVYHLAAITPVSYSFLHPTEVSEVNYIGTVNIVDACSKERVAHFIHASTSEFYGKQEVFPIPEEAIPYPLSPYAVSKIAAEEYVRFKNRTEALPYTIFRPYNTYNRSHVRKEYFVVERAITQALRAHVIRLYTSTPVRDMLDRDSHVDAYVKCLGNRWAVNQEMNIGTGEGHTIGEVASLVAKIVEEYTGRPVKVLWNMEPDRPYDIEKLVCSNEKAKRLLGWEPLYTLEGGLRLAVKEWAEVLGISLRYLGDEEHG